MRKDQTNDLKIETLRGMASDMAYNLSQSELIEEALTNKEGVLTSTGALMCDTGKFTGRSPQDRFIVKDKKTENTVWWGAINKPISEENFDNLYNRMLDYMKGKKLYVRDAFAGVDKKYQLNLRVINTYAWHNLFVYNMFLRPSEEELKGFQSNFTIICLPEFEADPEKDGTRQKNFAILNLSKRKIIVGGTAYSGEMKKGIFSVLNYILPHEHRVLGMHCSANMSREDKNTSIFFGLSGTGKTTLSADPNRLLIGDDEHGWTENAVFNFEGGCYAKVIDLTEEKEPDIYNAIKRGAILENTRFKQNTDEVDYEDSSVTENTRVSYPIHHIKNCIEPSTGGIPKNIFFLTCDAYGVIPPIQKLNKSQAMYHFISGYTSKVAGTETGITDPEPAFSACFGSPFLPLHPAKYAELLGEKINKHNANIWLVNTGWSGGSYGTGSRIKLKYTRAMITAVLDGSLDKVEFLEDSVFKTQVPKSCPNVPSEILQPKNTWESEEAYYKKANFLADKFHKNFEKFEEGSSKEILGGAPVKKG